MMMTQLRRRMFLNPPLVYIGAAAMSSSGAAKSHTIHIINTEKPQDDEDPMAYYIRTLSAVLGSEEAAKKAFVIDCGHGFTAANLTPDQAHQISKQPGVYHVEEYNRKVVLLSHRTK